MKSKKTQDLRTLAAAIAANVSSFEEIDLNARGKQSLLMKVASTLKLKCDATKRSNWRYLWRTNDELKNLVRGFLGKNKKREETERAESREVNIGTGTPLYEEQPFENIEQVTVQIERQDENEISDYTIRYSVVEIGNDGNCLFRCFSYCVNGNQEFHADIRKNIVEYVIDNWSDEVDMLRSTCEKRVYENEFEYAKVMGSDGTYGTDFELGIFVKLYEFNVVVFRKSESGRIVRVMDAMSDGEVASDTVKLLFSGQQRTGQWEVLEETKTVKELSLNRNDATPNKEGSDVTSNRIELNTNIESDKEEQIIEMSGRESDICNEESEYVGTNHNIHLDNVHEKSCETNPCYKSANEKIKSSDEKIGGEDAFDFQTDIESSTSDEHVETSKIPNMNSSSDLSNESVLTDSSGLGNIVAQKTQKRRQRIKIFTEDIGTVVIPSTHLKTALGYNDEDKVRKVIEDVMLYTSRCTCTLGFYGSVRYNRLDLVAYAKCRKPNHEQRFQFRIDRLDEPLARLTVSSNKKLTFVHEKNLMAETFRVLKGEERRKWQKDVRYRSVVSFLTEIQKKTNMEIKDDGHMQDLRTLDVIYKAKSEERCQERLALQSLDLSDLMELWIQENKKRDPFLRYVSLPLTAIMYTEEDLNVIHPGKPTVLHMDATGAVVRKPKDLQCKKIFYYGIVMKHDKELLTLAHMITSEHGVASISVFLKNYKDFVIKCGRKWPLANVITIDWSWAFIHAILQEWNLMTIRNYLLVMYDFCVNDIQPPKNMTILKSCYGHFMKRVSEAIRREFQEHIDIKSFLLECMGLMAICRNIKQLDEIFKHFATILLAKGEDETNDSFIALRSKLKKKSEVVSEILNDVHDESNDEEDEPNEVQNLKYCSYDEATIYKSSPFYQRYKTILVNLICAIEKNKSSVSNKYHGPKFIDYVVDKYMAYAVLWVSLDLDLVDPTISRISNAYIESGNRVMKDLVFQRFTTSSIADRVRQLRTARIDTMSKIILDVRVKGKQKSLPKPKYPETAANPLIQENWMRSSRRNKRKAGHLGMSRIETSYHDIIEKKIKMNETRKKESKLNELDKNKLVVQESEKLFCGNATEDISTPNERHGASEETCIETNIYETHEFCNEERMLVEEVPNKKIPKLYNGLVNDKNYYMASKSSTITVEVYRSNDVLSMHEFRLTTKEYATLRDYIWIDGVVIDCFVASNIHEWEGFTYISTDDTISIVGDCSGKRISSRRSICRGTEAMKDKLLMPYLFEGHWRLLIANTNENKLSLLDPYASTSDLRRAAEAFKNFQSSCGIESSFHIFKNIDWEKNIELNQRPHQEKNDGHSCGAYVMS